MASKKKSKKSGMCPCGHEIGWHSGPNRRCIYGNKTATGGCKCLGYRTRRYSDETAITSPAEMLSPDPSVPKHGDLDAHLERIEMRIDRLDRIFDAIRHALDEKDGPTLRMSKPSFTSMEQIDEQFGWSEPDEPRIVPSRSRKSSPDGVKLSKCAQAIVDTLKMWSPKSISVGFISIYSGYSVTSGGFAAAFAELRKMNCIVGSGQRIELTHYGESFASTDFPKAPTGRALVDMWKSKLDKCSGKVLDYLYESDEDSYVSAKDIAKATGYSITSGGFAAALAKLRALELIEGKNTSLSIHRAFDVGI